MTAPSCTDEEFRRVWRRTGGSVEETARILNCNRRGVQRRRRKMEEREGIVLPSSQDASLVAGLPRRGIRAMADVRGTVIVFSDCHWGWRRERSVAHKALVKLCKEMQPSMLIGNGDLADMARLCRQDPIGWDKSAAPSVKEEIEDLQECATEVALAAPKKCKRVRTIGNHDVRFERYLAMNAPEVEGLAGTRLDDFIPEWEACWSLMLNDSAMVKHRYHNGVHAEYNNTLKSGVTIVTGHRHRLAVTPWVDYNGRRWGVDTGSLADVSIENPAFDYDEDKSRNWCSGFAVLTFDKDGELLPPELCEVIKGKAYFRGKEV